MNIHAVKRADNRSEKIILHRNELVTLGDLQDFRIQLLKDFKQLMSKADIVANKPWLKSREVRKLLNISPGTLQTLRSNGTLRCHKVGGTIYYDYEDIQDMMQSSE
jgi:hypothetical protein